MLPFIVLLSMGLVQDGDRKPTESEFRAAHQMLSGVWQVVAVTDNGDPIGPELVRRKIVQNSKISIGNRVITHVNPESGETRTTGYMINPIKSPKEIDLITPEERVLPGIYKFEGDDLVVCFSSREGRARPDEFESTSDSFRTLMRLKVGGGASSPAVTVKPKAQQHATKPRLSAGPGRPRSPARSRPTTNANPRRHSSLATETCWAAPGKFNRSLMTARHSLPTSSVPRSRKMALSRSACVACRLCRPGTIPSGYGRTGSTRRNRPSRWISRPSSIRS